MQSTREYINCSRDLKNTVPSFAVGNDGADRKEPNFLELQEYQYRCVKAIAYDNPVTALEVFHSSEKSLRAIFFDISCRIFGSLIDVEFEAKSSLGTACHEYLEPVPKFIIIK
jgi:hypothetical protein